LGGEGAMLIYYFIMKKLNSSLFQKNELKNSELSNIKGGKEIVDRCDTAGGAMGGGGSTKGDTVYVYDDGSFTTKHEV
jgi:hypothetical protein